MSMMITSEHVARISDLYRRICTVTTAYTFTRPVDAADVATVRDELAAAVPECVVTMTMDERYVYVLITLDAQPIYGRPMIIEPEVHA